MADSNPICVSEIGLACSLGRSFSTACAAARAGLSRAVHLDYFRVAPAEGTEPLGVVGHAVPFVNLGFAPEFRLGQILGAAFADLKDHPATRKINSSRSGYYLSMPNAKRLLQGTSIYAESADETATAQPAESESEAAGVDADDRPDMTARALSLLSLAGGRDPDDFARSLRHCNESGYAGFTEAVLAAVADLGNGAVDTAVVAAVDSYLDEESLGWLESLGRLKSPDLPAGVMPGEAGVIFVIERQSTATGRGAHPTLTIDWVERGNEENNYFSGAQATGAVIAHLLSNCAGRISSDNTSRIWVVTDQNGEMYRASEWGNGLVRVAEKDARFADPISWYPASFFGDTGAASGAVSLALVSEASNRQYAPSETAILLSSDDGPDRSVMLVSKL